MGCETPNCICLVQLFLNGFIFHFWHFFFTLLFPSFSTSFFLQFFFVYECFHIIFRITTNLFDSFLRFSLIYKQRGGGVAISTDVSATFISCSWSVNTAHMVSTIVSIVLLSPSLDQPFISSRQSWYIYNINPKKYQKRFWIFSLILFTFQITKFHLLSLETIPFPYNY